MATNKNNLIQPAWWAKSLAGSVLGFTLAFALSGIFAWVGPGGIGAANKTQFVMWMIAPLWMLFFSLVYLFRTGLQALLVFGLANIAAYLTLFSLNGFFTA